MLKITGIWGNPGEGISVFAVLANSFVNFHCKKLKIDCPAGGCLPFPGLMTEIKATDVEGSLPSSGPSAAPPVSFWQVLYSLGKQRERLNSMGYCRFKTSRSWREGDVLAKGA